MEKSIFIYTTLIIFQLVFWPISATVGALATGVFVWHSLLRVIERAI